MRTGDVVTVEEMVVVVTSTRPVHHRLVFAGAFSLFTFFGAGKESKKYTDAIGDFEVASMVLEKFYINMY